MSTWSPRKASFPIEEDIEDSDAGSSEISRTGHLSWRQKLESFLVGSSALATSILIHGFLASLSIFFVEFKLLFPENVGLVSLTIFLTSGIYGSLGLVSGMFLNKFGVRKAAILGSLLLIIGIGASAFATSLPFLMVFLGIFSGTGCSFLCISMNIGVCTYFTKAGRQVMSLVTVGEGICTFIFPPLTSYFIEVYNWRGSLLLICGIITNCIPCGLMYSIKRPEKESKQKTYDKESRHESKKTLGESIPGVEYISGTNLDLTSPIDENREESFAASNAQTEYSTHKQEQSDGVKGKKYSGAINKAYVNDVHDSNSISSDNEISTIQTSPHQQLNVKDLQEIKSDKYSTDKIYGSSEHQSHEKLDSKLSQREIFLSILSNKIYVLFLFTIFVVAGSIITIITIIPDFCVNRGMTLAESARNSAIGAIGDIIARCFGTWLLYKNMFRSIIIFSISAIFCGIATAVYPFLVSPTYIAILTVCLMMAIGLLFSMYNIVVLDLFDIKRYPIAMGLSETIFGLGIVLSGYMIGLFTEYNNNDYTYSFYLLALLNVVCVLPILVLSVCNRNSSKTVTLSS